MGAPLRLPIRVTDPAPVPPTGLVRVIDQRGRERNGRATLRDGSLVLHDLPEGWLGHGSLVIDEKGNTATVRLGPDGYRLHPLDRPPAPRVLWAQPPTGQQLTVAMLRDLLAGLPDGMAVEGYADCGHRFGVDTVGIEGGVLCIGEG